MKIAEHDLLIADLCERLHTIERKDRFKNEYKPKDVLCTLLLFVGGCTLSIQKAINPFVYVPTGNALNPYLVLVGSWIRAFFHPPVCGIWKGGLPPDEASFFKWLSETCVKPTAAMIRAIQCMQPPMSPASAVYPIILNAELREHMTNLLSRPSELLISIKLNAMPTLLLNEFGYYQAGPHETIHVDSQLQHLERLYGKKASELFQEKDNFQFLGADQSQQRVQSATFTQVFNEIRRDVFGDTQVIQSKDMLHVGFWWAMISPIPNLPM